MLGGAEENLSAEEKARRERQRQSLKGFTAYQMSRDGARLLVTLSGRLYLVERATLKVTQLPGAGWIDPRFSPDGRLVAAAGSDRELHVIDPAAGTERAVTSGATATLSHGTAEFVAQEEMSRNRGYWWSPDSATLLVQQTDEAGVEVRHIADPLHPEAAPARFFYPRAGTPNAVVRLFLVSREGGKPKTVTWDATAFPYLAHVNWSPRAPLTILVQNRTQTEQRLLAVNTATGRTQELLRETDAAWLNLDDNGAGATAASRPPLWLADGTRFLWTTERNGAWQVELRDASGALVHEITPLTFGYRRLSASTRSPAPCGSPAAMTHARRTSGPFRSAAAPAGGRSPAAEGCTAPPTPTRPGCCCAPRISMTARGGSTWCRPMTTAWSPTCPRWRNRWRAFPVPNSRAPWANRPSTPRSHARGNSIPRRNTP
ncbi:MAG: DPP IV N-terminal domain-containing protein [Opitutaceae bacterium]